MEKANLERKIRKLTLFSKRIAAAKSNIPHDTGNIRYRIDVIESILEKTIPNFTKLENYNEKKEVLINDINTHNLNRYNSFLQGILDNYEIMNNKSLTKYQRQLQEINSSQQ